MPKGEDARDREIRELKAELERMTYERDLLDAELMLRDFALLESSDRIREARRSRNWDQVSPKVLYDELRAIGVNTGKSEKNPSALVAGAYASLVAGDGAVIMRREKGDFAVLRGKRAEQIRASASIGALRGASTLSSDAARAPGDALRDLAEFLRLAPRTVWDKLRKQNREREMLGEEELPLPPQPT